MLRLSYFLPRLKGSTALTSGSQLRDNPRMLMARGVAVLRSLLARTALSVLTLSLIVTPPVLMLPAVAQAAEGAPITLNFKDADIDSVIGAFGHLMNRTFIIDPRVRGKISLETPKPVPQAKALEMLQSVLRVQGFAMVESGGLTKVLPEAEAKLQAGPVSASRNGPRRRRTNRHPDLQAQLRIGQ